MAAVAAVRPLLLARTGAQPLPPGARQVGRDPQGRFLALECPEVAAGDLPAETWAVLKCVWVYQQPAADRTALQDRTEAGSDRYNTGVGTPLALGADFWPRLPDTVQLQLPALAALHGDSSGDPDPFDVAWRLARALRSAGFVKRVLFGAIATWVDVAHDGYAPASSASGATPSAGSQTQPTVARIARTGWGGGGRTKTGDRFTAFRQWLAERYGIERLRSGAGVLDIAGGKGELAFKLLNFAGVPTTIVDPRPLDILNMLKHVTRRHLSRLLAQQSDPSSPISVPLPNHIRAFFWYPLESVPDISGADYAGEGLSDSVAERSRLLTALRDCSAIVGMHPDQATEAIVDWGLAMDKPFAAVPCCVFPNLFAHRSHVRSHAQFCQYLVAKSPTRAVLCSLPFAGRNDVVCSRVDGTGGQENTMNEKVSQDTDDHDNDTHENGTGRDSAHENDAHGNDTRGNDVQINDDRETFTYGKDTDRLNAHGNGNQADVVDHDGHISPGINRHGRDVDGNIAPGKNGPEDDSHENPAPRREPCIEERNASASSYQHSAIRLQPDHSKAPPSSVSEPGPGLAGRFSTELDRKAAHSRHTGIVIPNWSPLALHLRENGEDHGDLASPSSEEVDASNALSDELEQISNAAMFQDTVHADLPSEWKPAGPLDVALCDSRPLPASIYETSRHGIVSMHSLKGAGAFCWLMVLTGVTVAARSWTGALGAAVLCVTALAKLLGENPKVSEHHLRYTIVELEFAIRDSLKQIKNSELHKRGYQLGLRFMPPISRIERNDFLRSGSDDQMLECVSLRTAAAKVLEAGIKVLEIPPPAMNAVVSPTDSATNNADEAESASSPRCLLIDELEAAFAQWRSARAAFSRHGCDSLEENVRLTAAKQLAALSEELELARMPWRTRRPPNETPAAAHEALRDPSSWITGLRARAEGLDATIRILADRLNELGEGAEDSGTARAAALAAVSQLAAAESNAHSAFQREIALLTRRLNREIGPSDSANDAESDAGEEDSGELMTQADHARCGEAAAQQTAAGTSFTEVFQGLTEHAKDKMRHSAEHEPEDRGPSIEIVFHELNGVLARKKQALAPERIVRGADLPNDEQDELGCEAEPNSQPCAGEPPDPDMATCEPTMSQALQLRTALGLLGELAARMPVQQGDEFVFADSEESDHDDDDGLCDNESKSARDQKTDSVLPVEI